MRDLLLYAHIIIGLALIALPILILLELKKDSKILRIYSAAAAALSWILLFPAGKLYLTFYPATKTLIKAGPWPWAHSIIMETKEHWGFLLPIIATVAACLVFAKKKDESKKWWILLIIITALIGVMGRLVRLGGNA